MPKISEMPEIEINTEDVFYLIRNENRLKKSKLIDVMDKYAIDFATFIQGRDVYLEQITIDDLLIEFKESLKNK